VNKAGRVAILMGSRSDLDHVSKIVAQLDALGVPSIRRVASAHKSVHHLLDALDDLKKADEPIVVIAVAGRSNALAGMVDANVPFPVITCPPVSSAFGGADIFSSLRMPGGVAPMVILEPEAAALAAAKILALSDAGLRERVIAYQQTLTDEIITADQSINA
jgi:5-(carboxyamino)imidazole ribonucleotide mutase